MEGDLHAKRKRMVVVSGNSERESKRAKSSLVHDPSVEETREARKAGMCRYLFLLELFFKTVIPWTCGKPPGALDSSMHYLGCMTVYGKKRKNTFTLSDLMPLLDCFPMACRKVLGVITGYPDVTWRSVWKACCMCDSPLCSRHMMREFKNSVGGSDPPSGPWEDMWNTTLKMYTRHGSAINCVRELSACDGACGDAKPKDRLVESSIIKACASGHVDFLRYMSSRFPDSWLVPSFVDKAVNEAVANGNEAVYDAIATTYSRMEDDGVVSIDFDSASRCFAVNFGFAERLCRNKDRSFVGDAIVGNRPRRNFVPRLRDNSRLYRLISTGSLEEVTETIETYGISKYSCLESSDGTCIPLNRRLVRACDQGDSDRSGLESAVSIYRYLRLNLSNVDGESTDYSLLKRISRMPAREAARLLEDLDVRKEHMARTECRILNYVAENNNVDLMRWLFSRFEIEPCDVPMHPFEICPLLKACSMGCLECAMYLHKKIGPSLPENVRSREYAILMSATKDERVLEWLVLCVGIPNSVHKVDFVTFDSSHLVSSDSDAEDHHSDGSSEEDAY